MLFLRMGNLDSHKSKEDYKHSSFDYKFVIKFSLFGLTHQSILFNEWNAKLLFNLKFYHLHCVCVLVCVCVCACIGG